MSNAVDLSQQSPSAEQQRQAAMDVVEGSRETEWQHPSFVAEMFMGRFRQDLMWPFPEQSANDRAAGDVLLEKLASWVPGAIDAEEIDRTGDMPASVLHGLAQFGCFGVKIPTEYGGLGLSQTNYDRAIMLIASHCTSTAVWLSAHQSIGLPQPLKMFGTPEQKQKYLPQIAAGKISAFALTELDAGSDPAKMTTTAVPTDDGAAYILNGTKLWCTNGPAADFVVVIARTPSKMEGGREKKQLTAFIVEKGMPGFRTVHRCEFMGLNGIQNGVLELKDVRVPKENILWDVGLGLKLALMTLNTGRLTLPASCLGGAKKCLEIVRKWSNERVQWGVPVGKHEAISMRIGRMAAQIYAMEATTWYPCALVDRGSADIRLEAAMAKMFCSETMWDIVNDAMQIKGGRGYETARSLKARGEAPDPIERIMRDCRINLIFEGSSEIMRLFIAREALDPHLKVAGAMFDPRAPLSAKVKAAGKMAGFYTFWYPKQWCYNPHVSIPGLPVSLYPHMRFVQAKAHKLARALFHAMGRFGPGLERRQMVLWRAVDIGTQLYAMAATCARASRDTNPGAVELADLFCRDAAVKVQQSFATFFNRTDNRTSRVARDVLAGRYTWLEDGIVA